MTIKDLKYFIAVCDLKNISKASKSLYISQQALSSSIKKLEKKFNVVLFQRTFCGVELTQDGVYLYEKIQSLLEHYDYVCDDLNSHFKISKNTINIGTSLGVLRSMAPTIFIDFNTTHSDINVNTVDYLDDLCQKLVMDDTIDIAISIKPEHTSHIDFISINFEPLMLLVNNNHPLSNKSTVTFKDLIDEPLITCDERLELYHYQLKKFKEENITPNFIYKTNEIEVMTSLVSQNKGMLICAKHVCLACRHDNVTIVPFADDKFIWEYGFLIKKNKKLSSNVHKLIDFIMALKK